jgi:hypothetical protein
MQMTQAVLVPTESPAITPTTVPPQADQHKADHGQGATAALVILRADDTPDAQRYRDESETGTGSDQREQRDRV